MEYDLWLPGVLSADQMKKLAEDGIITNCPEAGIQVDNSSFDLHLSGQGWEMIEGSLKPSINNYENFLKNDKLSKKVVAEKNNTFILKREKTYIFKLKEEIYFRDYDYFYGQATAKSSIGRMDVLARLIVDGMDRYDSFTPDKQKKSSGKLYIEITPITFSIVIKEDISLIQLRLFKGEPEDSEIRSPLVYKAILGSQKNDDSLSVDLGLTKVPGIKDEISGFYTSPDFLENDIPISLIEKGVYNPRKYWKFCKVGDDGPKRIKVEKDKFYILRSKEKIKLPESVAIYCRAMDETFGEMRIHYAGFVHPYFGYNTGGTPLIFEVRGHDVDVNLCDNEPLAKLHFYRMSKVCKDVSDGVYYNQVLKLSKYFKEWDQPE
ncbi:MAG: hypothetical protein D8M58_08330 [Calditrichaeota bacterium]|nr:MAG: hypothetical protein DWQ03_18160 [Calditrichota bacterium]MBL1205389.1 hypothetical protein [Calditrichota bacterium]NOG45218.1 hypothetical protein [Calditrichota bacterium]